MAKLSEMFPSRWLRAEDLNGEDRLLEIDRVLVERIGQGPEASDKYVIYFSDEKKGLVLNKTNALVLAKLYGDDTDEWEGKRITLFPCDVQFKQEMVSAIRIRPRVPKPAKSSKPAPPSEVEASAEDIPF